MRRTKKDIEQLVHMLNTAAAGHGDPDRYSREGAYGGHQLVRHPGTGGRASIINFLPTGRCYEFARAYYLGYSAASDRVTPEEEEILRAHRELGR